ncbi:MAG: PEP-CTERM sorting domain-containing protein [Gemmatimonadetes bacterium]|nr:PEP-CTERM sorting domain-containing protein [Gemmatimonadota bacterium]MDA1103171.1 PEP-CTERM sorting domain-containing protein [Gemmatimonadota bacterium]
MKVLLKGAAAAMAVTLLVATSGQAQLTSGQPPVCTAWLSALYTDCSGAWAGNDANQFNAVRDEILAQNWLGDPIALLGGAELDNEATTGTIQFGSLYTNFVLALKAGDSFSLYYFEGSLSSLDYSTIGSGVNGTSVNGLSHWNIYGGRTVTVPEPGTLLLVASGLLGMALLRRREESVQG